MIEQLLKLKADVEDGNAPALRTYIELKRIEKAFTDVMKSVQDAARDEAFNYGQKSFDAFGAKVELKNAASRWDYSQTHQVSELAAKLKTMQDLAQSAVNSEIYDENGVRIEPAKKIEGKATISITLKNN